MTRSRYLWLMSTGLRGFLLLSCLSGVLGMAFGLAFIYTSKLVIDIATHATEGSLLRYSLYTVGLVIGQLLCYAATTWLEKHTAVQAGNALRQRLFDRLLRSRWSATEQFHSGDIVNRIEQDTTAIVNLLTATIPSMLVAVIQLLAAFWFFCVIDPLLAVIVLAILPLFALGSRTYMRRMRRFTHDIRQSESRVQAIIQEGIQNRATLKILEHEHHQIEQLGERQSTLLRQVIRRIRYSVGAQLLVSAVFFGGYLTAFLWGAVRLSTGSMTFGTMTAMLQLVGRVQRPAFDLTQLIPSIIDSLTAADRLLELEQLPAEAEGTRICFNHTPDLELRDVCFAYSGGETLSEDMVFSHLSCRFAAGSCTAIVGETGRGKTTLIRLLLALAEPQAGSIVLDGHTPVSPHTRANFVYVPQGNTLFSGTIRHNLLMGNPQATEEDINQVLHLAVADFVFALPQGLDTLLHEQGGRISEGQAQRIAIARALLRPGRILLFDEATSALDTETESRLLKNLHQYYTDRTMIFVTHHPTLAKMCDAVLEL